MERGKYINCTNCNILAYKYPRDFKRGAKNLFCGLKCKGIFSRGLSVSPDTQFKKGVPLTEETRRKLTGRTPWNKGKKLHYPVWNKGLIGYRAGEKSNLWKGGVSFSKEYGRRKAIERSRIRRKDVKYRIYHSVQGGMWSSLKKNKKGYHWEDLVGYTLSKLMDRLSTNFKDGMDFSNYGQWHIDHKKPKSLFRFNSPKDPGFKCCWSLANLQPLWDIDNLRKGNKF